jgi:hypothetical protein
MDMTLTVIVDDQGELISTTHSGGQSRKRRCCSVLIERKKELCSLKTDGIRVSTVTIVSKEVDSHWHSLPWDMK